MNNKIIIIVILLWSTVSISQNITNKAFKAGENLKYVASFNMSGLWSDIAEVNMKVKSAKTSSKELYNLQLTGETYSSWDSYFKVRDSYQSWVNPVTTEPYLFKRSVSEGGYEFKWKYIFKRKSLIVKATRSTKDNKNHEKTVKIKNNTFDVASTIYHMRNMEFIDAEIGKVFKINVIVDAKLINISIKYLGVETLESKVFGNVKCYKLNIYLDDNSIVKNSNSNNIWVTADKNKVPVLIKAIIPVGAIQLTLTSASGLNL